MPVRNCLLHALGPHLDELRPNLIPAMLPSGHVLAELDEKMDRVFFPVRGIVSNRVGYEPGQEMEVVFTGRNNALGINEVIGVPGALRRVCLTDCQGWYVPVRAFGAFMKTAASIEETVRGFWQTQIQHVIHTSICNRLHTADQRLSRWLLLLTELYGEPELTITQEEISTILGVRRNHLNPVIHALRKEGILEVGRKRLRVLEFGLLGRHACDCYPLLRETLICEEVVPGPTAIARPGALTCARWGC